MKKLAIIDLGSNSVRMSIYEAYADGTVSETKNLRNMIKLSEGMTTDMRLRPEAQLRAVRAVAEYAAIIRQEGAESVSAVATAAVRKAKNGEEFLKELKDATGISVSVIDGDKEAYYDFLAVSRALGVREGVICDIGGGSTEIIAAADGKVQNAVSIPFGSRSITESFFGSGETAAAIDRAKKYINDRLAELEWLGKIQNMPIYGIGGCMRAVAKYDKNDATNEKLKRHEISRERMEEIFREISGAPRSMRASMTGIGEERADIILGGMLPLMCIAEKIGMPSLTVADVGVRDGILCDLMNKQG